MNFLKACDEASPDAGQKQLKNEKNGGISGQSEYSRMPISLIQGRWLLASWGGRDGFSMESGQKPEKRDGGDLNSNSLGLVVPIGYTGFRDEFAPRSVGVFLCPAVNNGLSICTQRSRDLAC
jgi:hypothetical protein